MTLPEAEWSKQNPKGSVVLKRYVPFKERALMAIKRAIGKHDAERKNGHDKLTPEQRKQLAQDYRETADRLERG